MVAFWQDLGLPGLIDVHTHFMPENVLAKVWAFFENGTPPWPIHYRRSQDERLARGNEHRREPVPPAGDRVPHEPVERDQRDERPSV